MTFSYILQVGRSTNDQKYLLKPTMSDNEDLPKILERSPGVLSRRGFKATSLGVRSFSTASGLKLPALQQNSENHTVVTCLLGFFGGLTLRRSLRIKVANCFAIESSVNFLKAHSQHMLARLTSPSSQTNIFKSCKKGHAPDGWPLHLKVALHRS